MSAALKITVILAAVVALASPETKVPNEKEKRGSDKDAVTLRAYQQQQQQQQQILQQQQQQQQHQIQPQHNFQYIYPQATQQLQASAAGNQYTQQQLQYILQQVPQQKQAAAAVANQYNQQQLQYLFPQGAQQKGVVGNYYVQQQAAFPQAYLGGQYYVHPGQVAGLGAQYFANPASPYYLAAQQAQAQQYYIPQVQAAQSNFYLSGLPANYQAYLGNQQLYQQPNEQQLLAYGAKTPSGVEPRGRESFTYVLPSEGAHQVQQYSTLPSFESSPVRAVHISPAAPAQAHESPALATTTSSGKYASKTSSDRQQG